MLPFGLNLKSILKKDISILLFMLMTMTTGCSAVENAIKDAAQDVGEELAENVGEQIEDKLSGASEEIKGEISGIKDDMKQELETAITSLRDELTNTVNGVNSSLSGLKDSLPTDVTQQLDKLVATVDGIKSVDDLSGFFNELSNLDSKMAALDKTIQDETNKAVQPLYETLNQYDIGEFKNALDAKVAQIEQVINGKSFEFKAEFEQQLVKVRESLGGLDNLRDISFTNTILTTVAEATNSASSTEDWGNIIREIVKVSGDVVEGITDVAKESGTSIDVNVNVIQNQDQPASTVIDTPPPPSSEPAVTPTLATVEDGPLPQTIQGGPVCEDFTAQDTSWFVDPCNPNITEWDQYTRSGYIAGRPNTNSNNNAVVTAVPRQIDQDQNKDATFGIPFEAKNVYMGAVSRYQNKNLTLTYSSANSNIWVKSGVRTNIVGSGKTVYFEEGAIINGEIMDQSKNYNWARYCPVIQPYYENCNANLTNNPYIIENDETANVPLDSKDIWVRFPASGSGPLAPNRMKGSIQKLVVDTGLSTQDYGNLLRYATSVFLLPGSQIALSDTDLPVYFLPDSESSIFPGDSGPMFDSIRRSSWPRNGMSYDRYLNQPHMYKSLFMCQNIQVCVDE